MTNVTRSWYHSFSTGSTGHIARLWVTDGHIPRNWPWSVASWEMWREYQIHVTGSRAGPQRLPRLLHSPILVASRLSLWYASWPPVSRHQFYAIRWSKYRLGLPQSQWVGGNFHCFSEAIGSPACLCDCARTLWKSLKVASPGAGAAKNLFYCPPMLQKMLYRRQEAHMIV